MGTIDLTHCEHGLEILEAVEAHDKFTVSEVEHKSYASVTFAYHVSRYASLEESSLPDGWTISRVEGRAKGRKDRSELVVTIRRERD